MGLVLNNVLSVLLWRPEQYRAPRREPRVAVLFALGTIAAGLWLFGHHALFVVGCAYLLALLVFPCKILMTDEAPPASLATDSVFARGLFAASVSTWQIGLAIAAGLPVLLIVAIGLHAALELWLQVLPAPPAASALPLPGRRLASPGAARRVTPRFRSMGPSIGTLNGREIAAWLRDANGAYHDYVGCTSDPQHFQPAPGQTVVSLGLIYQARAQAQPGPPPAGSA